MKILRLSAETQLNSESTPIQSAQKPAIVSPMCTHLEKPMVH